MWTRIHFQKNPYCFQKVNWPCCHKICWDSSSKCFSDGLCLGEHNTVCTKDFQMFQCLSFFQNFPGQQFADNLAFFHCSFELSAPPAGSWDAKLDRGSLGVLLTTLASPLVWTFGFKLILICSCCSFNSPDFAVFSSVSSSNPRFGKSKVFSGFCSAASLRISVAIASRLPCTYRNISQ